MDTPFSNFMQRKFNEYRQQYGALKKEYDWADFLGVQPGTLSHWLHGRRTPKDVATLDYLAHPSRLGAEVYAAAQYEGDPWGRIIQLAVSHLPEDRRIEIATQIQEEASQYQDKHNTPFQRRSYATVAAD